MGGRTHSELCYEWLGLSVTGLCAGHTVSQQLTVLEHRGKFLHILAVPILALIPYVSAITVSRPLSPHVISEPNSGTCYP
jgi:hypothetical protein